MLPSLLRCPSLHSLLDWFLLILQVSVCLLIYIFKFCVCVWSIFKVFVELVTILLLFYVLIFLAKRHAGSQILDQGSNLHPLR